MNEFCYYKTQAVNHGLVNKINYKGMAAQKGQGRNLATLHYFLRPLLLAYKTVEEISAQKEKQPGEEGEIIGREKAPWRQTEKGGKGVGVKKIGQVCKL